MRNLTPSPESHCQGNFTPLERNNKLGLLGFHFQSKEENKRFNVQKINWTVTCDNCVCFVPFYKPQTADGHIYLLARETVKMQCQELTLLSIAGAEPVTYTW